MADSALLRAFKNFGPEMQENAMAGGSSRVENQTAPKSRQPRIKFARYVNGQLQIFKARADEIDYVAFSHVWGEVEWRTIPGIPYEVKTSQEKADFVANDLPHLVGDGAFWMDTLTVNQRDRNEVLAIVQCIPTIFRLAKRTIAVRECDGLYSCCMQALEGFSDYDEFCARLSKHNPQHSDDYCHESYLQRLWTLQECLLSHTIQFVVGNSNQPKKPTIKPRPDDLGFYKSHIDMTIVTDALWVLAYSFMGSKGRDGVSEFLKAYVHGGTVTNPNHRLRTSEEDIHSGNFLQVNLASHRSATESRDYIFATMPQFPWYHYPKTADSMSFGQIYMDLYQQAANSGHAFTCRFTQSMLDPKMTDPIKAWLPSAHQPRPSCLGDFLKLLGHRTDETANSTAKKVHLTTVVQVKEFCSYPSSEWVLTVLESSSGLFKQQWVESHRGGELSKFGNFPSTEWSLDRIEALRCGWVHDDPEWKLRVFQDGDDTVMSHGPGLEYTEDDTLLNLHTLDEMDLDSKQTPSGHVSLFEQSRRILDHLWCAEDPTQVNEGQKSDWAVFKAEMRRGWTTPLLRTMLLMGAMVICRLPLSAAPWVNRLFVPVYVQYGDSLMTLGLLARSHRQRASRRMEGRKMFSVGQHLPSASGATGKRSFGKDHFLVDPSTKVPVGILPDFLPDERTDEEFVKLTSTLYHGLCQVIGGNRVAFMTAPLCGVNMSS